MQGPGTVDGSQDSATALGRLAKGYRWQDLFGKTPYHIAAEKGNLHFLQEIRDCQPIKLNEAWLPYTLLSTMDTDQKVFQPCNWTHSNKSSIHVPLVEYSCRRTTSRKAALSTIFCRDGTKNSRKVGLRRAAMYSRALTNGGSTGIISTLEGK